MSDSVPDDLAAIQDELASVREAKARAGQAQEFWIKDRKIRRADYKEVAAEQRYTERKLERAKRGGVRVQRVIP